jgi:hypothetical protein
MGYESNFLKAFGTPCTLTNDAQVLSTKMMAAPLMRSARDIRFAFTYNEGIAMVDSGITPGMVLTLYGKTFMVLSVGDAMFETIPFIYMPLTPPVTVSRETGAVVNKVLKKSFVPVKTDCSAFQRVASNNVAYENGGILDNTVMEYYLPNTFPVQLMDRVTNSTGVYMVTGVDFLTLPGILRVTGTTDRRP